MTRLGADPTALDRVARTCKLGASRLTEVDRSLRALLTSTQWQGRDRGGFDRSFNALGAGLGLASRYLEEASKELADQAAGQRRASGDDPGVVGARAGGVGAATTAPAPVPQSVLDNLANANTPAELAKQWAALTPAERAAIIAQHPDLVGNRDGISPADRIGANHNRIERDVVTATGDRKKLLQSWLADSTDPVTGQKAQIQVLLYDAKAGHVAVVWGNLPTAKDVVVDVPGTGTKMDSYAGGSHPGGEVSRARDIYDRAYRKSGNEVAVVAWLGYDAPQWTLSDNPGLSRTGIAGGHDLAGFTNGLGLGGDQRLALVGHSYGAFVVGEGIRDGSKPANVLVMGSPGQGVDNVHELGLPKGSDFFAMRAPLDPVGGLQRFGQDPTTPDFGGVRLSADNNGQLFSHSGYWTGKNLNQIAGVVTDTKVDVQTLPTPSEAAGQVLTSPLTVGDKAIDAVQRVVPLPSGVDHVVDVVQRPEKAVTGAVQTVTSEAVDGTVEVTKKLAGKAWSWLP